MKYRESKNYIIIKRIIPYKNVYTLNKKVSINLNYNCNYKNARLQTILLQLRENDTIIVLKGEYSFV